MWVLGGDQENHLISKQTVQCGTFNIIDSYFEFGTTQFSNFSQFHANKLLSSARAGCSSIRVPDDVASV